MVLSSAPPAPGPLWSGCRNGRFSPPVDAVVEAYQAHAAYAASPRLFLVTDRARLSAAPNILQATWFDAAGKQRSLVD